MKCEQHMFENIPLASLFTQTSLCESHFLIFVKFLFELVIIMTRVWKVVFVPLLNVLNMHVKIAWDRHRRKITKPNEFEGTHWTSLTKTLKDNYALICGQLSP